MQIPLFLDSSPNAGEFNISANRDRFTGQFDRPIMIPPNARNATVELNQSSVWNTTYNMSAANNNNQIGLILDGTPVLLEIQDGLYDIDSLEDAIDRALTNQGLTSGLVRFSGDFASQWVIAEFTTANQQIDFRVPNACNVVLGFETDVYPSTPTTGNQFVVAPNVASLNVLEYVILHTDIVTTGIPVNGIFRNVIGKVLLTSDPGYLINYQPYNPIQVPIDNQIGSSISQVVCWITDHQNNPIQMNDNWSMDLIIRYSS